MAEQGRRPDALCARQNDHRAQFSHGWAGPLQDDRGDKWGSPQPSLIRLNNSTVCGRQSCQECQNPTN